MVWIFYGCDGRGRSNVNTHRKTVYETKVIDKEIIDTNKIENFVKSFARNYYKWQQSQVSIGSRNEAVKKYLTEEL